MENYYLLHKNHIAAEIIFDSTSGIIDKIVRIHESRLLPISCQENPVFLKTWWNQRAVSKGQSNIKQLLKENNIPSTQSFLLDNLGLSITDAYWVKPVNSTIEWEQVSFHLNPFFEEAIDFFTKGKYTDNSISAMHTPSASSGGELKKKWIRMNDNLFLLKGNMPGFSFQQSLNEVFASKLHEAQGYENYVKYTLWKMSEGSYGCISECFTSEDVEFIPAWELFQKHGNGNNDSLIDRYIEIAETEGLNKEVIHDFMSYQTITDFLMTNIDRHLNNYGILRDSNTLEPIGPAPIFDTGNSMFYLGTGILSYKDLFNWNISSLYPTEKEMMARIKDYSSIDIAKVPSKEDVEAYYSKDPAITHYAGVIAGYYEFKRNILINLQRGFSYSKIEKDVMDFFGDTEEREAINNCWKHIS